MKKCNRCNIIKEDSEFSFKNKNKKILHSYCKECKREIDNELYSNNHLNRKTKVKDRQNKVQTTLKNLLFEIKKNSKCSICGENRWWMLDFHHMKDKKYDISSLPKRGCSLETFQKEIDKCIILCANCHRDVHFKESHEYEEWSNEKRT